MDTREVKGLEIAARMRVVRDGAVWSVPSQTAGLTYRVNPSAPSCTCEDFGANLRPCKHVHAVRFVMEREAGNELAVPAPAANALPTTTRPTYKQNWPAYNRAQRGEKDRLLVMLRDLCGGIQEPPRADSGRKPVPLADAVFASVFKVYSGFSSRRFNCDLQAAHAAGHLSRPVHCNKVNAFMENPALTPVLRILITESAAPLAAVETAFAPDSSAFSSHKFTRWFDVKHGGVRSEHEWVKVQMMCGVKTNIVTSADICEQDGPDSPYLPQLVNETAERFTVKEVLADKGYSSTYGHEAVAAVGGTPYIAFKRNATGGSGGVYGKMFHYFQYRREEFLRHYHQRSNAESVFSAVKRKFGDSLRSKSRPAMVNETLCKFLCHNLCVLNHEQEELGITAEFWGDGPADDSPAIIRFPGREHTA